MFATKENFPKLTPKEYFAWEEKQLNKHEYIEGEVYAMSGGSVSFAIAQIYQGLTLTTETE
ncbi:MAG: hypothetical protein WCP16_01905 [Pseudanabaena sp. ELA645]|jgi:Uma2 family endonuclease